MKLFFKRVYLWIASTWGWQFILTWIIPAIRFGKRPIPINIIKEISQKLQEGDCILVRDPLKFSHILIGGRFSHAGIVIEFVDKQPVVGEMGHAGYQELSLVKFLGYSAHVAVIRPKLSAPTSIGYGYRMAERAHKLGIKANRYDHRFELGEESLYCSELIYASDFSKKYKARLDDLAGLGHPYISPDGLYKARGAEIVYEWKA